MEDEMCQAPNCLATVNQKPQHFNRKTFLAILVTEHFYLEMTNVRFQILTLNNCQTTD